MNKTIFDQIIDRKNTFSAKWDTNIEKYSETIIPLSVADMDFSAPIEIIKAIEVANNGIYGYTILGEQYQQIISEFFQRRYKYTINPKHIVFCPRVIQAICIFIRKFTVENDYIGLISPSYSPITNCIKDNHRIPLFSELLFFNNNYQLNIEELEEIFSKIKVFILINPHNPTGYVWKKQDLAFIAKLAEKYNVFIISDDVHLDFCFYNPHYFISEFSDFVKENSIICTSPAKTFNMPGLEIANIFIQNKNIKQEIKQELLSLGIHNPNYFSIPAIYTAYQDCDYWIDKLIKYIKNNRNLTINFFKQKLPHLKIYDGGGTFLLWVNYQSMNLTQEELQNRLIRLAKVIVSPGEEFGKHGIGFFRLNIALPQKQLIICLENIYLALAK